MKKVLSIFFLLSIFSFLLCFPNFALEASRQGLLLWFDTLVPTLLPFLVLSQIILKTNVSSFLEKFLGPVFQKLFHCSSGGAFCILCGFLCGYPVGARLITLKIKEGTLTIPEGQYLLSFCNQVSPMFCISYGILRGIGTNHIFPYLLLIYGSAILWGILTRPEKSVKLSSTEKKQTSSSENLFQMIDVCIIDSFLILIKLCGYLILFSLFTRVLTLLLPQHFCIVITAVLEITNGISLISTLPYGMYRTLLTVFALSFGGICCLFQTNTILTGSGLSFQKYCTQKFKNALLTLFLCGCFFLSRFAINRWC